MANPTYDPNNADQTSLIDLIMFRVDEVTAENQTIGPDKEQTYRECVEALRQLIRQAPAEFIDRLVERTTSLTVTDETTHSLVELPADFLRFRALKMSEWKRETVELLEYGSDAWKVQFNPYSQANAINPVASLVPGTAESVAADGAVQTLQAFPNDSTDTADYLLYWRDDMAPETIPDELKDVVAYLAGARVLSNERAYAARDRLLAQADSLIGTTLYSQVGE